MESVATVPHQQPRQGELFVALPDVADALGSERRLAAVCLALGADADAASPGERVLLADALPERSAVLPQVPELRRQLRCGQDPLGEWFQRVRPAAVRRAAGAVYTPPTLVEPMLDAVARWGAPARVVDPGAGSGRFLLAAARRWPRAHLVAVEADPLAALMLRARVAVLGLSARVEVQVDDFRLARLPAHDGLTAFVGNPPYVRHHDIAPDWKRWYVQACGAHGIKASALAGLHLHFCVRTLQLARPGDLGCYVMAAEWLDVNYGAALRRLLAGPMGLLDLQVLDSTAQAFPGTASTAVIVGFRVGESQRAVSVTRRSSFDAGDPPRQLTWPRSTLSTRPRWSSLAMPAAGPEAGGDCLGELFRVHRGQVTGANAVWVPGRGAPRVPQRWLLPTVTRARELIDAGERLDDDSPLKRVVNLPADLAELAPAERDAVEDFLAWARAKGAHEGYIARHRKAWWAVGLRAPAPILCTYMGRRPPHFSLNVCGARHVNIAHGLYPRLPVDADALARVVAWLNRNVERAAGRTYAGGLTKFEPRELERLPLPRSLWAPA